MGRKYLVFRFGALGWSGTLKCLVFSLVVKLCDSTHLSFSYSLLFAWFCIEELVILPTIKKIHVIIQGITTAEFRHLSALTNTILCCECVIGLNEWLSVQIKVLHVNSAVFQLTWSEGLYCQRFSDENVSSSVLNSCDIFVFSLEPLV